MTVTSVQAATTAGPDRWQPGAATLTLADLTLRLVAREFGTMRWTLERTPPAVSSAFSDARAPSVEPRRP